MATAALEAIAVLDEEHAGILGLRRRLADVALGVRRHALQRRLQQRLRPTALVERLPHGLALQTLHRLDAGFAALAALGHALQALQGVKAVALERAVADLHRLDEWTILRQFSSGRRHVSGTDEPARNGTNSSRALSYIHLASVQVADRCLSLKTGTDFFDFSKTLHTSSKNRRRG